MGSERFHLKNLDGAFANAATFPGIRGTLAATNSAKSHFHRLVGRTPRFPVLPRFEVCNGFKNDRSRGLDGNRAFHLDRIGEQETSAQKHNQSNDQNQGKPPQHFHPVTVARRLPPSKGESPLESCRERLGLIDARRRAVHGE